MANEAIEHTAKITVQDGKKYVTINFHPIKRDGLIGHLQKFYYYDLTSDEYYSNMGSVNAESRYEVTGENRIVSFDDLGDDDELTFSEYISEVKFELPSNESDVICRVKVDAMGDMEQDAVIVFDYSQIKKSTVKCLEDTIIVAKSISNDDGNDYYLFGLIPGDSGATKLTFGGTNKSIEYFDKTISIVGEGCTHQVSFSNLYKADDIIVDVKGYSQNEETSSSVRLLESSERVAIDIDWSSAEKIANLPTDKTALDSLVRYTENRLNGDMSDYTNKSVENLKTALENANAVNENENATQEEVDAALANLQDATKALEKKPAVDTSALEVKISEAEAISNADGKYTDESYAALTAAVESAKAVLADESKTQESVDNAVTAVQTAAAGSTASVQGIYTVNIQLKQFGSDSLFMGNASMKSPASIVIDENNNARIEIDMQSLTYLGREGYLGSLKKVTDVLEKNKYNYPIKIETEDAQVLEEFVDVYDVFNDPTSSVADPNVAGKA